MVTPEKRIKRYREKGYQELSEAECPECFNNPGNYWRNGQLPIFFNRKSGFCFCTKCGARWKV